MIGTSEANEKGARILIVDDDRQNRQLLEVMLATEGYVIQTASSGEESLEKVEQQIPDLMLLDLMMPSMDGYEVAERLKAGKMTRSIGIIIVTSLNDRQARLHSQRAGADDFLTKPVDRTELLLRVRNLLRIKSLSSSQDQFNQKLEAEVASRTFALSESERLYRETFDAAPVGMALIGLDGKWLRANKRLCDLLGYGNEELQSTAIQDTIRGNAVAGESKAFQQMIAGTLHHHVVAVKQYRHRNGSIVKVSVRSSVHRDPAGAPRHFISVIESTTDQSAG